MKATFAALLFTISTITSATNYYVKNGGSDSSDGKSDGTAWATITKVNSTVYTAGDTVFFKKGDVWRGMLKVSTNGTSAKNMVFSSYGTGENPRILGSEVSTWNSYSTNVWVSAGTFTDPYNVGQYGAEVFFENADGTVSWGNRKTGTANLSAEFDWTCVSGQIYVYSSSDPDVKYMSVEIPQRAFIINLNDKNYLHFKGIDIFYCGESAMTYNAWPMQSQTGLIVEYCEVGYVSVKNSEAGYGIDATYNNQTIRHCEIHNCGRRSISHHLYGAYTATNILIEDNYFHDGFHTTGPDFSVGSSSSSYYGSIDGVIVRRNYFYDPPSSGAYSHHIFIQNYLYSTLKAQVKNIYIYSNIFVSPTGAAINMEGSQSVYIYNNTFYNNNNAGSDAHVWVDDNNSSVKVKNNIFYTTSTNDQGGVELFVRSGTATAKVDADYNLYYRINNNLRIVNKENTGVYFMDDIASIRSVLGWEKNSPTPGDPLFVSTSDLHVQAGSPTIGAGLAIAEVATDYEGKAFTNPPNIGCYASEVALGDPTYVKSAIENASPSVLEMTYNLNLAVIVPAVSAFTVTVNSVSRAVNSVAVSGTKVRLTLASAVVYGDVVTVAYTAPVTNPLQTVSGGFAATISAKPVTNNVSPPSPVYVSSLIANATPTVLEMTYSLTLANIVPTTSAFVVRVNSVVRTVSKVTISGTKVLLTLASAVVYGDVITVAYTQPASNPIQTALGGKAVTISAKVVTNNLNPANPVYVSSVIENAAPSALVMTYNLNLANIVPATSAFSVTVNSVARTINSVTVSGTKVTLALASGVSSGDVVRVAYTKPAANPLQTAAGGQAATIAGQAVINNVGVVNDPPVIKVTYNTSAYSGSVWELDASGSTDPNNDILSFTWSSSSAVPISSTAGAKIQFLAPIVTSSTTVNFALNVSDGKVIQSSVIPVQILPYKPGLEEAIISDFVASDYKAPDYPKNIVDGNIETTWFVYGDSQWIVTRLEKSFRINYLQMAFKRFNLSTYFDIYASVDSISWDPILSSIASCPFSGSYQIFNFPSLYTNNDYNFVQYVGHGNSSSLWNFLSELKIFGYSSDGKSDDEVSFILYPNPATDVINISLLDPASEKEYIRVVNISGETIAQEKIDPGAVSKQIPINVRAGFYIVQLISDGKCIGSEKLVVMKGAPAL